MMTVFLTPSYGMDVNGIRLTPVVIVLGPAVKVYQEPVSLYPRDGGHAYKSWVLSVLGLELHSNLKQAFRFLHVSPLSLKRYFKQSKDVI